MYSVLLSRRYARVIPVLTLLMQLTIDKYQKKAKENERVMSFMIIRDNNRNRKLVEKRLDIKSKVNRS